MRGSGSNEERPIACMFETALASWCFGYRDCRDGPSRAELCSVAIHNWTSVRGLKLLMWERRRLVLCREGRSRCAKERPLPAGRTDRTAKEVRTFLASPCSYGNTDFATRWALRYSRAARAKPQACCSIRWKPTWLSNSEEPLGRKARAKGLLCPGPRISLLPASGSR